MSDTNSFEQSGEAHNPHHPELAESVTSETSSHKMKIDELNAEEDQMDTETVESEDENAPILAPQSATSNFIVPLYILLSLFFRCQGVKHYLSN